MNGKGPEAGQRELLGLLEFLTMDASDLIWKAFFTYRRGAQDFPWGSVIGIRAGKRKTLFIIAC
jgi:hypothetical protein